MWIKQCIVYVTFIQHNAIYTLDSIDYPIYAWRKREPDISCFTPDSMWCDMKITKRIGMISVYKHCSFYSNITTTGTNKRPFVSTANEALVGTLMTIGDVNDIFAITKFSNALNSLELCLTLFTNSPFRDTFSHLHYPKNFMWM